MAELLPSLVCVLLEPGLVYDLDVGLGTQEVVRLPHTPTLYPPGLAHQVSLLPGVGECACGRQGWSVQLFCGWRHTGPSNRDGFAQVQEPRFSVLFQSCENVATSPPM